MTNEFIFQIRTHQIKKNADMEEPAFKDNVEVVVTNMFEIQWNIVIQEIMVRILQQNQEGQLKLSLEVCESAEQEIRKQEVEQSSLVTRQKSLYRKFRKMEPIEFDGSMDPG